LGWIGILLSAARVGRTLLKKRIPRKIESTWLYWLLVALIPAVVTVDAPHATRSLLFFWMWIVLAAQGWRWLRPILIFWLAQFLTRPVSRKLWWSLFSLALLLEVGLFSYRYFHLYPQRQPDTLKAGFEQTIQQVDQQFPDQEIAIVDPAGFDYILLAWYLKIPPQTYLENNVRQLPDKIGFRYGERVGRYHFIGQAEDRSADEKILLNWTGEEWVVTQYN
jgi:hypothetical protein